MEEIGRQIGILIAWPLVGIALGLPAFIASRRRGNNNAGWVALAACFATAVVFHWVGVIPVALIALVTILIITRHKT